MVLAPSGQRHRSQKTRRLQVYLDPEHDELLAAFAVVATHGNRSAAVSSLLDLHAGQTLTELESRALPDPVDFGTWDPRRLSRSLVNQLAGIVLEGADPGTAFDQAGVTEKTRRAWLKQGRADMDAGRTSLHATLVYALKRAEAERTIERVQVLGPEHAKWLLERQNADVYGPPVRKTESTVQHALNAVIDWDRLDVRETQTLVALLRKASPQADEPAVGAKARPVLELLPAEVVDADVIAEEDEPAPAVPGDVQLDATEAPPPDDDGQKPDR